MTNTPKQKTIPTTEQVLAAQRKDAERTLAERQKPKLPVAAKSPAPAPAPAPVAAMVTSLTAIPDSARRYLDKSAGAIVGKVIKINGQTGEIVVGDGTEKLDTDAIFIAHCDQAQVGFVNFGEDGEQPRRAMVSLFSGIDPPEREPLGDNDPKQWPVSDFTGEPRDPWVPQTVLVLQDSNSNALYSLIASSISARNAVDGLLRQYSFFPGEAPLVRLGVGKYMHKSRKTWIHYPDFRLVGRAKAVKPAEPAQPDFQDEIPF
jgi:hypothetical protein